MNDKTIQNWISLSQYDFETSGDMLKCGRYLYVAFTCQQTIEKILKAIGLYDLTKDMFQWLKLKV